MRGICLRLARRYAADRHEAEDIAQEALVRAWDKWSTLRNSARRHPWLASIVRNEALRMRARQRPEPREVVEGEPDLQTDAAAQIEERVSLQLALAQLDADERLLLRLRYDEDLTQPAIAERLALPEGTVKVRLHRARAKLHRALSQA